MICLNSLKSLFNAPLPAGTHLMAAPMFFMNNERGNINEMLLRADAEAKEIVENGDSLVKTQFFNQTIGSVFGEFIKISKKYYVSGNVPNIDPKVLSRVRNALGQISLYHKEKIKLSQRKIKSLEDEIKQIRAHFQHAIDTRNTAILLEYYPHWAELNDFPSIKFAAEDKDGIIDLNAFLRAKESEQAATNMMLSELEYCERSQENEDDPSMLIMGSFNFEQWIGTPDKILDKEVWINSCYRDIKRNQAVLNAIQDTINKFDNVLSPEKKNLHTLI